MDFAFLGLFDFWEFLDFFDLLSDSEESEDEPEEESSEESAEESEEESEESLGTVLATFFLDRDDFLGFLSTSGRSESDEEGERGRFFVRFR